MQNTNLISATIVKDSITKRNDRITTFKLVFPRYILAELNTHRVFTKSSASSRALPLRKMVKSALENPFIPIAFQKEHTGMQGTEYLDATELKSLPEFLSILSNVFKYESDLEINTDADKTIVNLLLELLDTDINAPAQTLKDWWLYCRDQAVKSAILMSALGVTKQLCNRILEPFLYHTVLLTATEYYNFFKLRCPKYEIDLTPDNSEVAVGKSWRELMEWRGTNGIWAGDFETDNTVERLSYNKGAGEIHIMDLAEKMYDALNESEPQHLADGEWHIPYGDNIDEVVLFDTLRDLPILDGEIGVPIFDTDIQDAKIKIATARMARISYETLGDNPKINYEADIKLHDDLKAMEHWSPFEHTARAMTDEEYYHNAVLVNLKGLPVSEEHFGWNRNFRGFIQYRSLID